MKSCDHIGLKISRIRTFYYYACIISEQYRYSPIIYSLGQVIDIHKESDNDESEIRQSHLAPQPKMGLPWRQSQMRGLDDKREKLKYLEKTAPLAQCTPHTSFRVDMLDMPKYVVFIAQLIKPTNNTYFVRCSRYYI